MIIFPEQESLSLRALVPSKRAREGGGQQRLLTNYLRTCAQRRGLLY